MKKNIYRMVPASGSTSAHVEISRDGGETFQPLGNTYGWGSQSLSARLLAQEILSQEVSGDEDFITWWQDTFCAEVIAPRPKAQGFTLSSQQVQEWCDEKRVARR